MSNMSYCRWHNTLLDLHDCAEHVYDDDLSDDERRARVRPAKWYREDEVRRVGKVNGKWRMREE